MTVAIFVIPCHRPLISDSIHISDRERTVSILFGINVLYLPCFGIESQLTVTFSFSLVMYRISDEPIPGIFKEVIKPDLCYDVTGSVPAYTYLLFSSLYTILHRR